MYLKYVYISIKNCHRSPATQFLMRLLFYSRALEHYRIIR